MNINDISEIKAKTARELESARIMLERTKNEMEVKRNANKPVASKSEVDDIDNLLVERMKNIGLPDIDIPKLDDMDVDFTISKDDEEKGIIRRPLEPAEVKKVEIHQKQQNIRPAQNLETIKAPKKNTKRKYDIIDLVSKGECYPHKKTRLPIYYLTANEENLTTSINLYKNGLVIDLILQNVIADDEIKPDDLIQPDIDGILLFLRANAYGLDFPIGVTNPHTKEWFEATIQLSQIKYNDFTLKGDENGFFDFTTPSGDLIKFTFPTRGQMREFNKNIADREVRILSARLQEMHDELKNLADVDSDIVNDDDKTAFETCANMLKNIKDKLGATSDAAWYTNALTSKMAMYIKSVNGNYDREYINEYIETMRAGDARKFRQYVDKNIPSLNYNIEVIIPEGQVGAGEVFTTELVLDDSIFLNVGEEEEY
jgi:hypothetical protein